MTIGFWVSEPPTAAAFAAWDPDREPATYASGVGHNVLELAKRADAHGRTVAVGRDDLPSVCPVVFLLKDAMGSAPNLRSALRAVQRARGRFAVVRSDTPIGWSFPVRPTLEFMPTRRAVVESWQLWLPPLPQRGLRPRAPERTGRIETLVLKCNPENIPPELRASEWTASLAQRGVSWVLDTPTQTDGSDQHWHDFTEVDAVLCAPHPGSDVARKPATRLINAWIAGCVPLAAREPAYLELGRDHVDTLFFDDMSECPLLLEALRADPARIRSMEVQIARRAAEFSTTRVSLRWLDALDKMAREALASRRDPLRTLAIGEKRVAHLAHEVSGVVRGLAARPWAARGRLVGGRPPRV